MESRPHADWSAEDQARRLIAFPRFLSETRGSLAGPRLFALAGPGPFFDFQPRNARNDTKSEPFVKFGVFRGFFFPF
jgi:hypothetical protein